MTMSRGKAGGTLDIEALERRVRLKLLSSPATVLPVLAGVTAIGASWGFELSPLFAFGGVVAALAGIGVLATRILGGARKAAGEALAEIKTEAAKEREAAFSALKARLLADGDPRTETLLQDLRLLADRFKERHAGDFELVHGIEQLFEACVHTLEQSLELAEASRGIGNPEARRTLAARREELLEEVERSVVELSRAVAQAEAGPGGERPDLSGLRKQIEERTRIDMKVRETMRALEIDPRRGE